MTTAKKIKCINKDDTERLILGKIYNVISETKYSYFIRDEWDEGGWFKDRFEVVNETPTTFVQDNSIPDNYTCTRCNNPKLNTSNDKVCWKCGEPVSGYTGG